MADEGKHINVDYTQGVTVDDSSNVKVYVRLRPPEGGAAEARANFRLEDQDKITLHSSVHGQHKFGFHNVFGVGTRQDQMFKAACVPLCDAVMDGYNATVFAYGQTGSGKTHTMFGGQGGKQGIIPRAVHRLFQAATRRQQHKSIAIVVSFLEIYQQQIRDLGTAYLSEVEGEEPVAGGKRATEADDWYQAALPSAGQRHGSRGGRSGVAFGGTVSSYEQQNLEIREDKDGHVFVAGLSAIPVTSAQQALRIVDKGFALRATHETGMNAVSSRSHTIFTMHIVQRDMATGEIVSGMLNMVDLAGSERLARSGSEGQRKAEAMCINSSLSALGKVVMALSQNSADATAASQRATDAFSTPSHPKHIPYRDSKLTRVLQNSLGGNSFTALVATVHPRTEDAEESLSTLQFATRCLSVQNKPQVNYETKTGLGQERRLKVLDAENMLLRRLLAASRVATRARLLRLLADLGVRNATLTPEGRVKVVVPVQGGAGEPQRDEARAAEQDADGEQAGGLPFVLGITEAEALQAPFARKALHALAAPSAVLSSTGFSQAAAAYVARVTGTAAAAGKSGSAAASAGAGQVGVVEAFQEAATRVSEAAVVVNLAGGGLGDVTPQDAVTVQAAWQAPGTGWKPGEPLQVRSKSSRYQLGGLRPLPGPLFELLLEQLMQAANEGGDGAEESKQTAGGGAWGGLAQQARRAGTGIGGGQGGRSGLAAGLAALLGGSGARGGGGGGGGDDLLGGVAAGPGGRELKRQLEKARRDAKYFKHEHDKVKAKVKTLKQQLAEQKKLAGAHQQALRVQAKTDRQQARTAGERAAEAKLDADDTVASTSANYSRQVAQVMANSQSLLAANHDLMASVPRALRISTDALARAAQEAERVRAAEEEKRAEAVARARLAAEAEIAEERRRFASSLADVEGHRDRMLVDFQQWSKRSLSREQEYKSEIMALWDYAQSLSHVVDRVQDGQFPLTHSATGKRAFKLKTSDLPPDPLATHDTGLRRTRHLLSKSGRDVPRARMTGLSATALSTMKHLQSSRKQLTSAGTNHRPFGAADSASTRGTGRDRVHSQTSDRGLPPVAAEPQPRGASPVTFASDSQGQPGSPGGRSLRPKRSRKSLKPLAAAQTDVQNLPDDPRKTIDSLRRHHEDLDREDADLEEQDRSGPGLMFRSASARSGLQAVISELRDPDDSSDDEADAQQAGGRPPAAPKQRPGAPAPAADADDGLLLAVDGAADADEQPDEPPQDPSADPLRAAMRGVPEGHENPATKDHFQGAGTKPERLSGDVVRGVQALERRFKRGDVDLDSDVTELDQQELAAHLVALRRYVMGGLRERLEDQVMSDLSSHETVQYIRRLESQRDAARRQAQERIKVATERERQVRLLEAKVRKLEEQRLHLQATSAKGASAVMRASASRGSVRSGSNSSRPGVSQLLNVGGKDQAGRRGGVPTSPLAGGSSSLARAGMAAMDQTASSFAPPAWEDSRPDSVSAVRVTSEQQRVKEARRVYRGAAGDSVAQRSAGGVVYPRGSQQPGGKARHGLPEEQAKLLVAAERNANDLATASQHSRRRGGKGRTPWAQQAGKGLHPGAQVAAGRGSQQLHSEWSRGSDGPSFSSPNGSQAATTLVDPAPSAQGGGGGGGLHTMSTMPTVGEVPSGGGFGGDGGGRGEAWSSMPSTQVEFAGAQ